MSQGPGFQARAFLFPSQFARFAYLVIHDLPQRMFPTDNLAHLQQAARVAHLRHAERPYVLGPFATAFGLWRKHYEARAALGDQNPAFALRLLPKNSPIAGKVPGLPLLPAGMRWAVDEAAPGTVTVTVDVAGTLTLSITAPGTKAVLTPVVVPGTTRQTATFKAAVDGLYRVGIVVSGTTLAVVHVPVQRARFLDFRELSRALAFEFDANQNPTATDDYSELLAVLYACDAAAATGQPELFEQLASIADAIPKAIKPVALFPRA